MIILSGVLVVLAIALLVTGIVTGNTGHEILGLDGLKLIYVSIGVSIVSALFLAVGVFLRRKELFGTTAAPANAKASAGRATARPVKAKARVGAGDDAAIVPATSASATDVPAETTVYVVPGRKRYHLETCRQLAGRDKEELTFVEAREEGFTPCTACLPDTALAARAALTETIEERSADTGTVADTRPQSAALEPIEVTRTDIPVTPALPAAERPSRERDALTGGPATTGGTEATEQPETDVRDAESTTVEPADAEHTTADAPEESLAERSRRHGRSLFEPLDRTDADETADGAAAAAKTDTGASDTEHRDDEPTTARSADEPEPAEPQDETAEPAEAATTRETARPEPADRNTAEPATAADEDTEPEAGEPEATAAEATDLQDSAHPDTETDDAAAPEPAAEEPEPEPSDEHGEQDEEPAADEPAAEEPASEEAAAAAPAPPEAADDADAEPDDDAAEQSPEPAADADTAQTDEVDEADEADEADKRDKAEKTATSDETAKAAPADDSDDSEDSDDAVASSGPTVRILSGTKRYHRSDCALIEDIADDADDLESLSREAARERGCTPCLVCQPDDD
ncbi:hypothetical protein AB0L00_40735 [Actinoallomurus sp. NPDC052308]|uniref:hypothetical protein n=1 Tax=Actinoallomurus sp. NPDC052308 TaxID=3155530 RepID=UPI0034446419